jgi:hypothetical protein
MPAHDQAAERFRYDGYAIDRDAGVVSCTYSTAAHGFTESFDYGPGRDWDAPGVDAAVRLLFLLAGVSYYKTVAGPVVDLGDHRSTEAERRFLRRYYLHGLGEFAYRNGLDLSGLTVAGPEGDAAPTAAQETDDAGATRPLIPFGGGIDSIVTVDALAGAHAEAALCVVHPPGQRFAAIEEPAAVTGLPVVRIERAIDPLVTRSAELGFLNGHVPVTAIITAAALVAAALDGRDAVVLSNEWSASVPTIVADGVPVNHQWSKSEEFERALADVVRESIGPRPHVFSYLRPRSELWIARRFADLTRFHESFRSCNRAFHQDPAQRLDHWCGTCDKCCFVDLVLAPFMEEAALARVFDGREPLAKADNAATFERLLDLGRDPKPFECVGDTDECRAAVTLAAAREDRRKTALLLDLAARVRQVAAPPDPAALLTPRGSHLIPERYAPGDLLVRAR